MRPMLFNTRRLLPVAAAAAALCAGLGALPAQASSHREAPFISGQPKVDGTDFYMFNSYESGRVGTVTLLANYIPAQDPAGGPNFYSLDPNALYEIHIDNDGAAPNARGEMEDITFQFRFTNNLKGTPLSVGVPPKSLAIPLVQSGEVKAPRSPSLNLTESFTVDIVRGGRRSGSRASLTNAVAIGSVAVGDKTFDKPVDNIGTKTIPDYPGYARQHIYTVNIPGCTGTGRVFVGQRKDAFKVNLGAIFDLVNAPLSVITDPALINAAAPGNDTLRDKNVTTLALEVPASCLTASTGANKVIGGWTTASVRQGRLIDASPKKGFGTSAVNGGAWTQVSRLGMPLVNEVVIGLPDKDRFNASKPSGDGQFLDYVSNPTLPALLELALGTGAGSIAPTNPGRKDLVTVFLTGVKGVNQLATVTASEMLRLNTDIPAVPFASQNRLGVLGGDNAGFPNGRRLKDDVVDISLVAVAGGLCMANGTTDKLGFGLDCNPSAVPLKETSLKLHDAVDQAVTELLPGFPYLNHPLPGSAPTPTSMR